MALSDKLLKEKVREVRQLAPNFSNVNDIVLILEHYNYDVEQTVSAIMENGGADALQSWTQASKGAVNKPKKKPVAKKDDQSSQNANNSKDTNGLNTHETNNNGISKGSHMNKSALKATTTTHVSNAQTSKTPHVGLEKSHKELQRQITSLLHLKIVFNERVEKSYKRINEVFKELQQQLAERQSELIKQLDASKSLASNLLDSYEQKSKDLKTKVDRAPSLKESEAAELRADVKDFVASKRHFEEVAHSCKFDCDFSKILLDIQEFGKVHGVQQTKIVAEQQPEIPEPLNAEPVEVADSSKRILNQSESLLKYEAGDLDPTISTNDVNEVNHANKVNKDASPSNYKPVKNPGRNRSWKNSRQGVPSQGIPKKPVDRK